MLVRDRKKEIRGKKAKKLATPILSYSICGSLSENEIQLKLDRAFEILFSETIKNKIDNNRQQ